MNSWLLSLRDRHLLTDAEVRSIEASSNRAHTVLGEPISDRDLRLSISRILERRKPSLEDLSEELRREFPDIGG